MGGIAYHFATPYGTFVPCRGFYHPVMRGPAAASLSIHINGRTFTTIRAHPPMSAQSHMAQKCHTALRVGVQKAMVVKGKRHTPATVRLWIDAHDGATQRNLGRTNLRCNGRELDNHEQGSTQLKRSLQPEIQAARAEVVEARVQCELLTRCVNASDYRRKMQVDSQRVPSLHVLGEHWCFAGERWQV